MKKNCISLKDSSRGFGLLEAIVATSLVVISFFALSSLVLNMQKESKALTQKADLMNLRNTIMTSFMNSANCQWQFNPATNPHLQAPGLINISAPGAGGALPGQIHFNRLYLGTGTNSPLAVERNQPLAGTGSQPVVSDIYLGNFRSTGAQGNVVADLTLELDQNSLVYSMRPLIITQSLQMDVSNPTASRIINCASSGSNQGVFYERACGFAGAACQAAGSTCNPNGCLAGDTEISPSSCEYTNLFEGGPCGYQWGKCKRVCKTGPTTVPATAKSAYYPQCGWTTPAGPPTCTPPACQNGDTDLGVDCGANSVVEGGCCGYTTGFCRRICVN